MSLRRILPAVFAVLALAGCPDVDRDDAPTRFVVASLDADAGVLPLPNDLALQAAPGRPPGVQREVLFSYIGDGGWPGDQTITVPIRTIARDDTGAFNATTSPPAGVDPATVTPSTVAIVRVSDATPTVLAPEFLGYGVDPANPTAGLLRLRPAGGLPVGRYVVAIRGGANGVKTADQQEINPDSAFAILRTKVALTPENQPPGLDAATLARLEGLRGTLANPVDWAAVPSEATCRQALGLPAAAPLPEGTCWLPAGGPTASGVAALDAAALVFPLNELASIQTFEVASPAVVADTATGVLPFPSDFLLGANGRVRNIPSLGPAAPGLATLDGFSTTGLLLVPLSGPVNADTITRDNVMLFELVPTGVANPPFNPRRLVDVGGGAAPEYLTQPPNLVRTVGPARVATAIGLQPAVPVPTSAGVLALPPLKPGTRYLVVVTDGVTDLAGQPLSRGTLATLLLTVGTPLFDPSKPEGQRSNVPGVADADAAGLQTMRDALRQIVPSIEGATGKGVVMAYTVTTQNVKGDTANMSGLPYLVSGAAPTYFAITTPAAPFDPTAAPYGLPAAAFPNVSFVTAEIPSFDVLDAATGALNPALAAVSQGADQAAQAAAAAAFAQANPTTVTALVAIPQLGAECTQATPCARPLVVFKHGLNGSKYQMLPAAAALAAKGFVVAAIDAPLHGDRAACDADADCNGGTCTLDPANQKAPGVCTGGSGLAFDAARLSTAASGNYFVSENFFRIRDTIRQDLLDHSALILAVAPPSPTPPPTALAQRLLASGVTVDATRVYFSGLSLGGIVGTSMAATNPRISRAAYTAAGGTMVDVFTNAPAFREGVGALFARLIPGFTFDKVSSTSADFDPAIAQRYAQTLIVAKWILDPVEPVNYAADVRTKASANPALIANLGPFGSATTEVYGQMIQDDPVVPNPFNALLYANGQFPTTVYTSTTLEAGARHGVLLSPTPAGNRVRTDLADFLETATPAAGTIALP